ARVIGATGEETALAPSISVALSAVAEALDYTRRPKVVMTSLDFPTVAYPRLAKRARGVELVVAGSLDHGSVPVGALARAGDGRGGSRRGWPGGSVTRISSRSRHARSGGTTTPGASSSARRRSPRSTRSWAASTTSRRSACPPFGT